MAAIFKLTWMLIQVTVASVVLLCRMTGSRPLSLLYTTHARAFTHFLAHCAEPSGMMVVSFEWVHGVTLLHSVHIQGVRETINVSLCSLSHTHIYTAII